jgi:hypothetical protein
MPKASTFDTALGLTASKFKSDHIVSCIDGSVKLGEITDCLSAPWCHKDHEPAKAGHTS